MNIALEVLFSLVYFMKATILQIINVFRNVFGLGFLIKRTLFDCLSRLKDHISLDLTEQD